MTKFLVTRNFTQPWEGTFANCIREAVILAEEGDTVVLDYGRWDEDVNLNKALTLRGRGARDESIIRGEVRITGKGATLRSLTVSSCDPVPDCDHARNAVIGIKDADDVLITDCVLEHGSPGIHVKNAKRCRIQGCLLLENSAFGIRLEDAEDCEVVGCELDGNSWHAMQMERAPRNRILGNRMTRAGWAGVSAWGGSHENKYIGNVIIGSNVGLALASGRNIIEGNRIEQCNHGIMIGNICAGAAPSDTQERPDFKRYADEDWSGNQVRGNDVRDSKREGVLVRRASENHIEGNTFRRSQFNDIVIISEDTNTVGKNTHIDPALADVADLSGGYKLDHKRGRVLWGDTHMHSECSDAAGSVAHGLAYGRDALGLDFVASADHSESMTFGDTIDRWGYVCRTCKEYNEPGRFVAFPGFELTYMHSWWAHFNVYYAGFDGPCFSGADLRTLTINTEAAPLENALNLLKRVDTRHLVIRHHFMACPGYWDRTIEDPEVIPGTDICSVHAIWEKDHDFNRNGPWTHSITTVQQAFARGYRFAVMAGSDSHYGLCGDYALTAVMTDDFSIHGIFDAIQARRTYATTGEKIDVEFDVGGHGIGEAYVAQSAPVIKARVTGTCELESVQVLRDNAVIHAHPGGEESVGIEFEDGGWQGASFYYLRAIQRDGGRAWTTPVWINGE